MVRSPSTPHGADDGVVAHHRRLYRLGAGTRAVGATTPQIRADDVVTACAASLHAHGEPAEHRGGTRPDWDADSLARGVPGRRPGCDRRV